MVLVVGVALGTAVCSSSALSARFNRVKEEPPRVEPSPGSIEFHEQLFVADLHADPLLLNDDLASPSTDRHIDIPRMIAGNVALQGFGVPTQVPAAIVRRTCDLALG